MMSLKNFLFKDYEWEQQPSGNKKGYRLVYRYQGKWKRWNLNGSELLRHKIIIGFAYLLCACFFFYGSTVFCGVNRLQIVKICTLAAFGAIVFLLLGVLYLICSGGRMTEADAVLQKQLVSWSAAIGTAALLLTVIFGITMRQSPFTAADCSVLACNAAAAVLEAAIFILQIRLEIRDV